MPLVLNSEESMMKARWDEGEFVGVLPSGEELLLLRGFVRGGVKFMDDILFLRDRSGLGLGLLLPRRGVQEVLLLSWFLP